MAGWSKSYTKKGRKEKSSQAQGNNLRRKTWLLRGWKKQKAGQSEGSDNPPLGDFCIWLCLALTGLIILISQRTLRGMAFPCHLQSVHDVKDSFCERPWSSHCSLQGWRGTSKSKARQTTPFHHATTTPWGGCLGGPLGIAYNCPWKKSCGPVGQSLLTDYPSSFFLANQAPILSKAECSQLKIPLENP